jgi:hypothetical protein
MKIKCFLLIATPYQRFSLRRFYSSSDDKNICPLPHGYHDAHVEIGQTLIETPSTTVPAHIDKTDPRWPTHCGCGYQFTDEDKWQHFMEPLYSRQDNHDIIYTLNEAPVGAIWRATWYEDMQSYLGPDGQCLVVKTPGGDWVIDGRANNCTLPNDNIHKCWVRHGVPPMITVDKNGKTCGAGAGSILVGNYHGFLINGELVGC